MKDAAHDERSSAVARRRKKIVQSAMWSEARKEAFPLGVGALAMVASSSINQMVPRLMGSLMESPSSKSSNGNNTSNNAFVSQIIWLGALGGFASFLRTFVMTIAQ